jgi:hypothetical protein
MGELKLLIKCFNIFCPYLLKDSIRLLGKNNFRRPKKRTRQEPILAHLEEMHHFYDFGFSSMQIKIVTRSLSSLPGGKHQSVAAARKKKSDFTREGGGGVGEVV